MYGADIMNIDTQFLAQQHQLPKIDPKAEDAKLREQTDAFESVILKMLMDDAMKDEKIFFHRRTTQVTRYINPCIGRSSQRQVPEDLDFLKCFMIF